MNKYTWTLIVLFAIIIPSCRKEYKPAAIINKASYLVVEGVLLGQNDTTTIKLSRTSNISSKIKSTLETGATVTIEANQGDFTTLNETDSGKYSSIGFPIDTSYQYRLRIKTKSGEQYLSDFVHVKVSPPIDSVGYSIKGNNLNIYLNTHDPSNRSRYYRWEYEENWEFHADYESIYIAIDTIIRPRNRDEQIYYCYGADASNHINIASSLKIKNDVVFQNPIITIPSTSEKIETKYSILVKQYVLTKEAYQFWQNLQKNTEQLGSIFDAQPSQLVGNIHCLSNASEPVIGFFSAGDISKKRIYITTYQLPGWQAQSPYQCEEYKALLYNPNTKQNDVRQYLINSTAVITRPVYSGGAIIGYYYSDSNCADCTIRGSKQPPAFWK